VGFWIELLNIEDKKCQAVTKGEPNLFAPLVEIWFGGYLDIQGNWEHNKLHSGGKIL